MLVLCIRGHPPPCSSHLFRLTCHMGAVRSPHARPPGLRDPTGLAASAHCSVPSWGLLLQIPRHQHLHQEVILSLEGHLLSRLRGGRGRPDHGRHGLGHRLGRRRMPMTRLLHLFVPPWKIWWWTRDAGGREDSPRTWPRREANWTWRKRSWPTMPAFATPRQMA